MKRTIVALFCETSSVDPVAPSVLAHCKALYDLRETDIIIDGRAALKARLGEEGLLYCVPTATVASYDYRALAKDLNHNFPQAEAILVVNWHAGNNAPNKIFCAHATSDVTAGVFGPTSSRFLSTLLLCVEQARVAHALDDWKVLPEASHWSGSIQGRPAEELLAVNAPVYDLEIGSYPDAFGNELAQRALAEAIGAVVGARLVQSPPVLFVGGIHFEPSVHEALILHGAPVSFGHVLPNQWLVSGQYQNPESELRLLSAAKSDRDGVQALVYHDGLKGAFKETVRKAASLLGCPCFSHKKLRDLTQLKTLLQSSDVSPAKAGNAN